MDPQLSLMDRGAPIKSSREPYGGHMSLLPCPEVQTPNPRVASDKLTYGATVQAVKYLQN